MEISLLLGQEHASVPLFDTPAWHARGAAELALNYIDACSIAQ